MKIEINITPLYLGWEAKITIAGKTHTAYNVGFDDALHRLIREVDFNSSTSSSIDSEEPNAESVGLSEDLAVFCFDCEHYAYDRRWCTLTKITMNRNNSCPEYDSLHRKEITE